MRVQFARVFAAASAVALTAQAQDRLGLAAQGQPSVAARDFAALAATSGAPTSAVSPDAQQEQSTNGEAPSTTSPDPDQWGKAPRARNPSPGDRAMDERMEGITVGTRVQSPAGEPLGRVKDVVPDAKSGRAGFVLIQATSGLRTAVPYSTVVPLIHDGTIVLERSRLEHAPPVRDTELQDSTNNTWREQAKQYWAHAHSSG